jgi:uncharacterized cupredoxin-like copper-binding protein
MPRRYRSIALLFAVTALAMTACSNDKKPSGGTGETAVAVTLQEYALLPSVATATAGKVTFNPKNVGPKKTHEFVVVKTDLAPESLPTEADGSVSEGGAGIEAVGELEDIAVGASKTITFTLAAGKYVLFCNVVETEGSTTLVHYKLGMRAAFTVS